MMSAKDEMLEYLWKESTVDMKLVHKCIAAVQLEAVDKAIDSICITDIPSDEDFEAAIAKGQFIAGQMNVLFRFNEYLAELRKAAGRGE